MTSRTTSAARSAGVSLESAVDAAAKRAGEDRIEGAVVLLSPGGASFDQYSDFEARGEAFRELVHALPDAPCNAAGGAL